MRMPDEPYLRQIEKTVAAIEERSAAEIVVTFAARSGSYRDVDMTWGAVMAFVGLGMVVYAPVTIPEQWILPIVAMCYCVAWYASYRGRIGWLCRLVTSHRRRRQQVHEAARVAFLQEGVDATPQRTGILFYVSMLESEVDIVRDHGVRGKTSRGLFNAMRHHVVRGPRPAFLSRFQKELEQLETVLGEKMPATADTDHNLPNRPNVLL